MEFPAFTHQWKNDVFLSFRGTDTRFNFTSHLFQALSSKGINTFIDPKIERGSEIAPSIVDAIKASHLFVVVFSPDYASSSYCLDELLCMLSCCDSKSQFLLPIFYKVDPADVERQTGSFGEAMDGLEAQFSGSVEKVKSWRSALSRAAKLAGFPLDSNGDEATFIQIIVESISKKLKRRLLHVAEHPVGLENHVREVMNLLSIGFKDVRMVGICGTGGIGKTTLAKAIFNRIAKQFEGNCFLENVRKTSEKDIVQLQETMLFEVLGDRNILVGNFSRGINFIKERLCNKRVLIVIDDVDHVDQVKNLAAVNWFGSGSRIIITTRDEHLLVFHDVKRVHRIKELCDRDALVLFSWNAFKRSQPPEDYLKLSENVVSYAKGLPIALVVLGSFLCGRKVPEWESEIAKLERNPKKEIYEILKISYDGLDDNEKAIFLDIACFFKGMEKDVVIKILDSCDLNPVIGLQVLVEKNLITVENKKIQMHSLLQSMGKQVVFQQSPKPKNRSRLWFHEDVWEVLTGNMGTDDTEGILLELPEPEELRLCSEAFAKMRSLRILFIRNAHIVGGPLDLPSELRWLEWPSCPLLSMPSGFFARKLVGLNMHRSSIKHLGAEFKNYNYLKFIDLRDCEFLTETPDFSTIPNLEMLNLGGCSSLIEVHESVGHLHSLVLLSFEFCGNLRKLPSRFELRSLQTLLLNGCTKLESFPEIVGEMKLLEKVSLDGTSIKGLPSSIEKLTGLKVLILTYCKSLISLPSSIYRLEQLKRLLIEGCSNLCAFPVADDVQPMSVFRCLELKNCHLRDVNFLMEHHCFSMLRDLDLSGNDFTSIPHSIRLFNNLRTLKLSKCSKVEEIPELPPRIKRVEAQDCESLKRFSQLAQVFRGEQANRLHDIDLSNCQRLAGNESKFLETALHCQRFRQDLRIEIILPGSEIPEWFSYCSESDSQSFQVPSQECEKVKAVVLCAILSPENGKDGNISRQVFINGHNVKMFSRQFFSLESDHVWLYYLPRRSIKVLQQKHSGTVDFRVSFEVLERCCGLTVKRCGVCLITSQVEAVGNPSGGTLSLSCQMSLDLKRSYDNELDQNANSKVKKRATEELMPEELLPVNHVEMIKSENPAEQQAVTGKGRQQ